MRNPMSKSTEDYLADAGKAIHSIRSSVGINPVLKRDLVALGECIEHLLGSRISDREYEREMRDR